MGGVPRVAELLLHLLAAEERPTSALPLSPPLSPSLPTCSPPSSAGSFFCGGLASWNFLIASERSSLVSVMSCSPEAVRSSRWFMQSAAHCSRLSVSRPLYLRTVRPVTCSPLRVGNSAGPSHFERRSAVVFLSMIALRFFSASAVIL